MPRRSRKRDLAHRADGATYSVLINPTPEITMFRALGRLAGFVEDEYEHIVADFSAVTTRLREHIARKQDRINEINNEIGDLQDEQHTAANQASKSQRALTKLEEIFG